MNNQGSKWRDRRSGRGNRVLDENTSTISHASTSTQLDVVPRGIRPNSSYLSDDVKPKRWNVVDKCGFSRDYDKNEWHITSEVAESTKYKTPEDELTIKENSFRKSQRRLDEAVKIINKFERRPFIPKSRLMPCCSSFTAEAGTTAQRYRMNVAHKNQFVFLEEDTKCEKSTNKYPAIDEFLSKIDKIPTGLRKNILHEIKKKKDELCVNLGPTATNELKGLMEKYPTHYVENQDGMIQQSGENWWISCASESTDPLRRLTVNVASSQYRSEYDALVADISADLGVTRVERNTFDFSVPNAPFTMSINSFSGPDIGFDDIHWPYAVFKDVIDDECDSNIQNIDLMQKMRELLGDDNDADPRIVEVRRLTKVERDMCLDRGMNDCGPRAVVVKFSSLLHMTNAKWKMFNSSLPFPVDLMQGNFDPENLTETIEADIFWACNPKSKTAVLKLRHAEDVAFAQRVLNAHCINVRYKERDNVSEKYRPDNKEMLISSLPHMVYDDSYLNWFISRILKENDIEYEYCRFNTLHFAKDIRFAQSTPQQKVAKLLFLSANELRMKNFDFDKYDCAAVTSLVNNVQDHEWRIETIDNEFNAEKKYNKLRVRFNNVENGDKLVTHLCSKMPSPNFFLLDDRDRVGARILPRFTKTKLLTKNVRLAIDGMLKELDAKLLNTQNIKKITSTLDEYNYVRIIEEWEEGSIEGVVGIEGWPKEAVVEAFQELQDILEPCYVDCSQKCSGLLYGVGEAYMKNFVQKTGNIVAEADKFGRKILIFGAADAKRAFSEKLEEYDKSKERINIRTIVKVSQPRYLESIRKVVQSHITAEKIKNTVGAKKLSLSTNPKHCIEFEGSIVAFERLVTLLDNLNEMLVRDAFEILCSPYRSIYHPTCPVCLSPASYDYFRLDSCGHVYCRECINSQILHDSRNCVLPMKCAISDCEKNICASDIEMIVLGDSNRMRTRDNEKLTCLYRKAIGCLLRRANTRVQPCKTPDCIGLFEKHKPNDVPKSETVRCFACDHVFCSSCFVEPHERSCEEFARLRENADWSLEVYINDQGKNIRRCPVETCKAVVVKAEGCNHVQCAFCKIHFCWICEGFLGKDAADIYRHLSDVHGGHSDEWQFDAENNLLHAPANAEVELAVQQALFNAQLHLH